MERARELLPGGVSSPVRSFRAVGGTPPFFSRGQGPHLFDLDGNRYLDMVLAYGPLILGHRHPEVVRALTEQLERGTAFGGPTEAEVELASEIRRRMPSVEMLRLVNSGTEATMSAVRLARAATGRELLLKFEGCYHGHSDALLAQAGSGLATLSLPGSPGVPRGTVADTLVLPYNRPEAVEAAFRQAGERIAAVVVEPVPGNMGVVLPGDGFLQLLRQLTSRHGSLLIFDEVITGFRLGAGGAQALLGVTPDLTCLGKVIGGGLPVGAFGGRRDLMSQLAPEGPVYQAGTLSGNPLAVAAGLATLRALSADGVYPGLERLGAELERGLTAAAAERGLPLQVNRVGSMLTFYLAETPVRDLPGSRASDHRGFSLLHRALLSRGVFWPPSGYESAFLSSSHREEDLELLLEAFGAGLGELAESRGRA